MTRLLNSPVPNTVGWYLDSYCPLFSEIAALCGTQDLRMVDEALSATVAELFQNQISRFLMPLLCVSR